MTKDQLRRYQDLKREQEQLRFKLEEVEAVLYSPKMQQLTGMPASGSNHAGNPQENLCIHHIELQKLYKAKLAELAAEQFAIEQAIEPLDALHRVLLRYRYIDGFKWEDVCDKMHYSWRQTHYLHREALQQLRELTEGGG